VFPTCYGVLHRSVDFTNEEQSIGLLKQVVPHNGLEEEPVLVQAATFRALVCFAGFNVGGVPFWFKRLDRVPQGRFLGSFWGVGPACDEPFPFVNRPEPLTLHECLARERLLAFGSAGAIINFFLKDDGSVDWHTQYM